MSNFIISGFSDEIDENIIKQFEHLNKLGIEYFEPRGINGKNISKLNDEEAYELKDIMDKYGIKVSSIGSPIGKIKITDDFAPHLEELKRVIKTAKILGTKYIRMFSFFIPEGENDNYKDEVIFRMKEMTKLAESEDIILLHENEKGIYGDIAPRCLEILEAVNSDNLRAVFDPANFVQCNQKTYPEAYEMLKDYVVYMHIKDAVEDGAVVPAGYGIGHIEEIITELHKRNYDGFLSLEPHLGVFAGLKDLELSDDMLSLSESTPDKFTLAFKALGEIVDRVTSK